MIIKGNQFYKVCEDFGDWKSYANEQGIIDLANNDRTKEDGTQAEEFKDLESAKKFLEEEKGLNVIELDATEIQTNENYITVCF